MIQEPLEALKQHAMRLTASEAVDLTDDIVYEVDADGNQSWLNRAGHRALCLDPGAGFGKRFDVFIHEDDLPVYREAVRHALDHNTDVPDLEARLVATTGEVMRTSHRLRPLRNGDDGRPSILGIARDVSNLRRVEEQLHQSQKLETIGLLAGGIAHDFNNMLAAILGYTELMLEEKDESDPHYRGLTYIHSSTERAAALVRQILIYTRKSGVELKPVRLGAILEETLLMLRRALPKKIRVVVHQDEQDDHIMGDPGRIQQALMNLCLNARDAMPNGGELRIEVDRVAVGLTDSEPALGLQPGRYVRIRVQDTGQGIPPHILEQIWAPFFTTKPAGVGTGLGLSVVQQIVQAHHGYITAESGAQRSASFFVYLPASTETQMEAARQQAEPEGGEETLLVVDDEPVLLELLRDILQPKGYHVLAAGSPTDALVYVEAVGERIDLVITDNMMPGMSGRELAREIASRFPAMKILACSGFSPTQESELGEMDYVSSYVQKPYQRRDLLARVREALDSRDQAAAPSSPQ
jgi:two-component system, cell cycle sensor histidine kinase and response regulator CckA